MSWMDTLSSIGVRMLSSSGDQYASDPHSRVHHGLMYHCSALDTGVASDANFDMMITTPSDDYIHMVVEAAAGGLSELRLYEGVTATGGTAETVYNLKRTSTRVWGGTMVTGPTVSDLGALLSSQVMPGGSRNQAVGSAASFDLEWVCKASTSYLVRITNRSSASTRASIGCNHYSASLIADV